MSAVCVRETRQSLGLILTICVLKQPSNTSLASECTPAGGILDTSIVWQLFNIPLFYSHNLNTTAVIEPIIMKGVQPIGMTVILGINGVSLLVFCIER